MPLAASFARTCSNSLYRRISSKVTPAMVCDLAVARVEFARLFHIGERFIPTILALINPGRDYDRLGIIRQSAPGDSQLVTYRSRSPVLIPT